MNDIILNKIESIERCIAQIRTYYRNRPGEAPFETDHLSQDAIAINLQRAYEQAIDMANYMIRTRKLGLPKDSKESFRLLAEHTIITRELASSLERMVGFRNVLVHQYQKLDIGVMIDVIENRLDDFAAFTVSIVKNINTRT